MVKVVCPPRVFSRCYATGIAGYLIAKWEHEHQWRMDDVPSDDDDDELDEALDMDEPIEFVEPPTPEYVDDALWLLKNGLLRRIDHAEMEMIERRAAALRLANSRKETMRLYDTQLMAAVDDAVRRQDA